ncbi:MAG: AmmeMemoRadiSam system protein B [Thermotogae bacterium]|jgi:AmmeMemoRadiSam system protein B|nr:AmmeMemoRadiSam system protein B [Thermotogota bacterium]
MDRKPIAAGSFYPSDPEDLRDYIRDLFTSKRGPGELPDPDGFKKNVGLIVPHAGYVYSGTTAAYAYLAASEFGKPDLVVIMGPNHTGYGKQLSVWPMGSWKTPLGSVSVDESVANSLVDTFHSCALDYEAHIFEHSIEVQIPFLQFTLGTGFKILPICMMDQRKDVARELGNALRKVLSGKRFWIVASTDLNHYEDHEMTLYKDKLIIKAVESNNIAEIYDAIDKENVTMCGFGCVTTLLSTEIGTPEILKHSTSGEISEDFDQEVGYMAACVC